MSNQEWFRKKTWTDIDREDFFAHLQRCRKSNRDQYLKIQGHYLYETNRMKEIKAALDLTNLALSDNPKRIYLAELLELKANCLNKFEKIKEAEENLLLALQTLREFPYVKPNVPFSFGVFVIERKICRLYKEVLLILDEFIDINHGIVFPTTEYYFFGIKAIIINREGNFKESLPFARKAIAASQKQYSGLSRHPEVGLVNKRTDTLYNELIRIAQ